jgi:thiol-disulfide isomerase/thioredoxin
MKNLLLLAIVLLPTLLVAQGIQFVDTQDWKAIIEEARSKNKIIFVDAYAVWCGPCRMMSSRTFTDAEVGQFYNANFINAKIDMEKGDGPALARQYGVKAYPTFLFISPEGDVVHQGLGYMEPAAFVALGEAAAAPEKQLGAMLKRYEAGDRSPALLKELAYAAQALNDGSSDRYAAAYLATQKNWDTPEHRQLIFDLVYDIESKAFAFISERQSAFEQQFGKEKVNTRVMSSLSDYGYYMMQSDPDAFDLGELEATFNRVAPPFASEAVMQFRMNYYRLSGDADNFAKAAVAYLDKYPTNNADLLNSVAWAFYEDVTDKKALQKAVSWALRSIELHNEYAYNDTAAALYYKLRNKKKAKEYADKAIALAKKSGEDYSETTTLLKKIQAL